MTNVEALKAVYTAIGGNAADVANAKTTAKVIEKISEIATPGGGGDASLLVCTYSDGYLDKTWQEIADALTAGKVVLEHGEYLAYRVSKTTHDDDGYWVWIYTDGLGQENQSLWCEGPNDYPNDD